jgi:hypothetical protein
MTPYPLSHELSRVFRDAGRGRSPIDGPLSRSAQRVLAPKLSRELLGRIHNTEELPPGYGLAPAPQVGAPLVARGVLTPEGVQRDLPLVALLS